MLSQILLEATFFLILWALIILDLVLTSWYYFIANVRQSV